MHISFHLFTHLVMDTKFDLNFSCNSKQYNGDTVVKLIDHTIVTFLKFLGDFSCIFTIWAS